MPSPDALVKIKATLTLARDLETSIEEMEFKLAEDRAQLNALQHKVLPDQFNSAGITSLTIEAEGNHPAIKCDLRPYFKASIPAKWSEEKREAALAELDKFGAGDLAKRTVTVQFARSEADEAQSFSEELDRMGVTYTMQFDVHHATLTSWLKETVSEGNMPDLEKIGGQVGQVVSLKRVDE